MTKYEKIVERLLNDMILEQKQLDDMILEQQQPGILNKARECINQNTPNSRIDLNPEKNKAIQRLAKIGYNLWEANYESVGKIGINKIYEKMEFISYMDLGDSENLKEDLKNLREIIKTKRKAGCLEDLARLDNVALWDILQKRRALQHQINSEDTENKIVREYGSVWDD